MGSNNGTGQPISFLCGIARRKGGFYAGADRGHGDYVRTGRTRPRRRPTPGKPSTGEKPGDRMLQTSHEYRCECGHVGWTRHVDILRWPLADTATSEDQFDKPGVL